MRTILFILQKEFRQIFRNKGILPVIFIMPVVQLLILPNAATFEIKNLRLQWVDHDHSSTSRLLHDKFAASSYFEMVEGEFSPFEQDKSLEENRADLIIEIPQNLERTLFRERADKIALTINAIDGTKAGVAANYTGNILADFNRELDEKYGIRANLVQQAGNQTKIPVTFSYWYNPDLNYKTYMVPGILVLLVTMIGAFLSSMNIVKEKEAGTIEQLNVTPIKKYQFIIGKLLPFWFIALFVLSIGLVIAKLVYQIPIVGSLGLIYVFAGIYLLVVLGLGLFISTITETQQQAMFISWFFLVIFILLSGLFTAIENMPPWAQTITLFNPVRYFIEVSRLVLLKGAGFADVQFHLGIMLIFAILINSLAVWKYRKTV
jgi:ABC-2 type transport system permease protein